MHFFFILSYVLMHAILSYCSFDLFLIIKIKHIGI
jgi:hypothetical protein